MALFVFAIDFTPRALDDLRWFRARDQRMIVEGIQQQLRFEPTSETRNRKRLRANATASWELRIGFFRVLYEVDDRVRVVEIQRIGEKRGNRFWFRGQEEDL